MESCSKVLVLSFKEEISTLKITTSIDLANYVLENYKFAMLPGIDFGFEKEDLFFRIAFVDFDGKKVMNTFHTSKKIDANFIQENAPNVFSGVEKIKKFISDLKN